MRILRYKCTGLGKSDWEFSEVEFGRLNLLVGDTATGKTRLLNTIFNVGSFVALDKFVTGAWDMTFRQAGRTYHWTLATDKAEDAENARIIEEKLWKVENDEEIEIIDRTQDRFSFNDKQLPKLNPRVTSLSLLKEEDVIRPVYEGFGTIRLRRFFLDELAKISQLDIIPPGLIDRFEREPNLRTLYSSNLGLNATLFLLSKFFPDIYKLIRTNFKAAFPFVQESSVRFLSQVAADLHIKADIPVFCVKERGGHNWIPLPEMSSGMQKVLLIITDSLILPNEAIYMIDEYENSLGIGAIDFFPDFVLDLEKEMQFFVTSHHPYIINKIPPKNWYIFNRKGTSVSIKYGSELEERFGKSKQKAFTQLINDPFYVEGVE